MLVDVIVMAVYA